MFRIFYGCLLFSFLFLSIGCHQRQERPQYSQEQNMMPAPYQKDQGYVQYQEGPDRENPEYTDNANNVKSKYKKPDRTVGYWQPEEIERSIRKLQHVKNAKVVITKGGTYLGRRNAFVGLRLAKKISAAEMRNMENQIHSKVREVEPNVDRIYLSTKESFWRELDIYRQHVKVGYPEQDMEKHIRRLIERSR